MTDTTVVRSWAVHVAAFMACTLSVAGCTPGDPLTSGTSDRQTRVLMNVLSVFYGDYLDAHRGNPPKDVDAFRAYLESRAEDLKRYKLKNVDQLMTSPRDGQPLAIVCAKRVAPPGSPGTPWAAYEQSGVEGTRMAVQVRAGVQELSPDEIEQIFAQ